MEDAVDDLGSNRRSGVLQHGKLLLRGPELWRTANVSDDAAALVYVALRNDKGARLYVVR